MKWAYYFVPYAWTGFIAAGKIIMKYVKDEVASEGGYDCA